MAEVSEGTEDRLPESVDRVRASNPGHLTLSGTNTYLIGEPAWVVDPGPPGEEQLERVIEAARRRGGIEGIVLTHRHTDHAGAAMELRSAANATLAFAEVSGDPPALGFREPSADDLVADVALSDGDEVGPFEVIATPGHSSDHLSFRVDRLLFCGDTVLGEGSVFIPPGEDAMREYFESLRKLSRLSLETLCPGHGPVVWDPPAKLQEYIEHRLDRERRLSAALAAGVRRQHDLLDQVWDDVPLELRPAAALTLEAHLEKLEGEGRLPTGVERLRF